jgi:hypothetical protein
VAVVSGAGAATTLTEDLGVMEEVGQPVTRTSRLGRRGRRFTQKDRDRLDRRHLPLRFAGGLHTHLRVAAQWTRSRLSMAARPRNLVQRTGRRHRVGLHSDVAVHVGGGGRVELGVEERQPRSRCRPPRPGAGLHEQLGEEELRRRRHIHMAAR